MGFLLYFWITGSNAPRLHSLAPGLQARRIGMVFHFPAIDFAQADDTDSSRARVQSTMATLNIRLLSIG